MALGSSANTFAGECSRAHPLQPPPALPQLWERSGFGEAQAGRLSWPSREPLVGHNMPPRFFANEVCSTPPTHPGPPPSNYWDCSFHPPGPCPLGVGPGRAGECRGAHRTHRDSAGFSRFGIPWGVASLWLFSRVPRRLFLTDSASFVLAFTEGWTLGVPFFFCLLILFFIELLLIYTTSFRCTTKRFSYTYT